MDKRSLSKYRTVAQPGPRIGINGMLKSRQHLHEADEHEQYLLIGFGSFSFNGLSGVGFSISLFSTGFTMSVVGLATASDSTGLAAASCESVKSWTIWMSWLTSSWRTEFAANEAFVLKVVISGIASTRATLKIQLNLKILHGKYFNQGKIHWPNLLFMLFDETNATSAQINSNSKIAGTFMIVYFWFCWMTK